MKKLPVDCFVLLCFLSLPAATPAVGQSPDTLQRRTTTEATDSLRPPARDSLPPPVELTAEEDHRRMMELLGIEALRPGPSGDPSAPNAANTDEAKATPYTSLPDPLRLESGERVTTPEQWWDERRPEIVELFDREIYGRVPEVVPHVTWHVLSTKHEIRHGVPVVVKELVGRADNSVYPPIEVAIDLTVVTPAEADAPVPAMIHYGFRWPPGFEPPAPDGPTWQEQLLEKGWGYAVLIPTSIQADDGAGLTRGIIGLANRGRPRDRDDWGALRAWAWGASRALDYLETDPDVEAAKVGIEGLSRYGKAAIVAMAYEPRLAIGFIGSSGAGGAKILRRIYGEQVENLASSAEYHWFAGNFIKYAGPLAAHDLPVDAHQLIALAAPRPVFISTGSPEVEGHWVDARGMYLAAVHAGPVYDLLGKKGLSGGWMESAETVAAAGITAPTDTMPPAETGLLDGEVAFRMHAGGHTTGPNWPYFLDFASRILQPDTLAGEWVGTWATSVQLTEPRNLPPEPGLAGNTLRQIVRASIGGDTLRVRFSNAFGTSPLDIQAAHIALSRVGDAIDPLSDRALSFGGAPGITIPPGGEVLSDPLPFALAQRSDLAITTHFGDLDPEVITGHPGSRTTSYIVEGDAVSASTMPNAERAERWYVVAGVDVAADENAAALVALGNSITDGRGSGTNEQNRWPDELARRLQANARTQEVAVREVAVLNAGIGGNCVLRACLGPSALDRFDRDVLLQKGVKWLIILEGINDLGTADPDSAAAVADRLISAYQTMIERAHERGISVYGGTLLPFGGSFYDAPEREAARQRVNAWIRTSGAFDAVIDFDAALRDPENPTRLRREADTGDHLHPNERGYEMMAETVDLGLF